MTGGYAVPGLAEETTGNLWFVLPRIAPPPGGADRVAFLMLRHRGLIELVSGGAEPFLAADVFSGERSLLDGAVAARTADWIPTFSAASAGQRAAVTWLTPHDERGWLCRLTVCNEGSSPLPVEFVYTVRWAQTRVATYAAEPLHGTLRLMPDGWGGGIGLGWATQRTEFGVGVGCTPGGTMHLVVDDPVTGARVWSGDPARAAACEFPAGVRATLTCRHAAVLAAHEARSFDLFMSIAPDNRAACLDARYLREQGFDKLLAQTRAALVRWQAQLPAALAADEYFAPLVRRNRLFTYFFSLGRTLDTEEVCPVTSRSSDYYVSAAYWDRDSLLWSFPTILHMDATMARRVLEVAFGRQGRNIGTHSRFIDGSICEQGFELDELCAPILALGRYLRASADWAVLDRIDLDAALTRIGQVLAARRHSQVALFSTDYLPTDDQAELPYCVYDNVLVWALARTLVEIETARGNPAKAKHWRALQADVAEAVRTHGIVTLEGRPLFAWSVDLDGRHQLYDEPPGSLALLAWYGFVRGDDPVFQNTCAWIYSPRNAHYFAQVDEVGCKHEPHPWVLAIANSLLLPQRRAGALALLQRATMDHGLACEAIDEQTGAVVSGRHFATCAGFLAHALVEAFEAEGNGPVCGAAAPLLAEPATTGPHDRAAGMMKTGC
jgi:uncharacterized protein